MRWLRELVTVLCWSARWRLAGQPVPICLQHDLYILRCEAIEALRPVLPHERCFMCGAFFRRWWQMVPSPCDCMYPPSQEQP